MQKKHLSSAQLPAVPVIALSVGFLFFALLLALALFSYNPADPAWRHNNGDIVHNQLGSLGAWFSDLSFSLIGKLSYLLPLTLVAFFIHVWREKQIDKELFSWRLFMLFTAILSGCVLWAKHDTTVINSVAQTGGGAVGAWLAIGLEKSVKSVSVIMTFSAMIFGISISLLFNIPWGPVADKIGNGILGLFTSVFGGFKAGNSLKTAAADDADSSASNTALQDKIKFLNENATKVKRNDSLNDTANANTTETNDDADAPAPESDKAEPSFTIDRYRPEPYEEVPPSDVSKATATTVSPQTAATQAVTEIATPTLDTSSADINHLNTDNDLKPIQLGNLTRHHKTVDDKGHSADDSLFNLTGLGKNTAKTASLANVETVSDKASETTDELAKAEPNFFDFSMAPAKSTDTSAETTVETTTETGTETGSLTTQSIAKSRSSAPLFNADSSLNMTPRETSSLSANFAPQDSLASTFSDTATEQDSADILAAPISELIPEAIPEAKPKRITETVVQPVEPTSVSQAAPAPTVEPTPAPQAAPAPAVEPTPAPQAAPAPAVEPTPAPQAAPAPTVEPTPAPQAAPAPAVEPTPASQAAPAPAVEPTPASQAAPAQAVEPTPAPQAAPAPAIEPTPAPQAAPAPAVEPTPAPQAAPAQAVEPTPAPQAAPAPAVEPTPVSQAATPTAQVSQPQSRHSNIISQTAIQPQSTAVAPQVAASQPKPAETTPQQTVPSAVAATTATIGKQYDSSADLAATQAIESDRPYELPSINLLDTPPVQENAYTEDVLAEMAGVLEATLKQFNIKAIVMHVSPGPVITRFELELAPGIQAKKITNLSVDLARALAVDRVRVEEVIPGSSYVGLEVPNKQRQVVYFKDVVCSKAFRESQSPLTVSLGADTSGKPQVADLMKMPHALVAGTTGSGKSVCINVMLLSMLFKASPKDLRLIMVDPKMLEMSMYEDIPHLLTPVITDMNEAENALTWAVAEMERRYQLMAALKVRKIDAFNEQVEAAIASGSPIKDPLWEPDEQVGYTHHPTLERLPFIVIVIDELADMMMVVGKQVEQLIARLTQKARAAGIHVVLATQRPSTDVLTGLIKANVPTRIAFQVSSGTDSRVIIDSVGAEKLLGHGDMLFVPPGVSHPQRLHGAFVGDTETDRITSYLRSTGEPQYVEGITRKQDPETLGAYGAAEAAETKEDADPLYEEAVQVVLETGKASISSVQRHLRIGYNRAARMIEDMQEQGVVSEPVNGVRKVLGR